MLPWKYAAFQNLSLQLLESHDYWCCPVYKTSNQKKSFTLLTGRNLQAYWTSNLPALQSIQALHQNKGTVKSKRIWDWISFCNKNQTCFKWNLGCSQFWRNQCSKDWYCFWSRFSYLKYKMATMGIDKCESTGSIVQLPYSLSQNAALWYLSSYVFSLLKYIISVVLKSYQRHLESSIPGVKFTTQAQKTFSFGIVHY